MIEYGGADAIFRVLCAFTGIRVVSNRPAAGWIWQEERRILDEYNASSWNVVVARCKEQVQIDAAAAAS